MVKQITQKNHYVPESYLKRWTGFEQKVHVYRTLVEHKNVPIWKQYYPSEIAYKNHLYTLILNGVESDQLESLFDHNYESPAKATIDKVIAEDKLSSTDWKILINFLAAQDVRTPSRLLEHINRAHKSYPKVLQNVLNDLEKKLKNKTNLNYSKNDHVSENKELLPLKVSISPDNDLVRVQVETYIGRSSWLWSIKYILENTSKILHSYSNQWTIIKPAKGYYWPTSDNPVVKINYYNKNKYDLKGGWGVENGNILFPLGPEHAMFIQIGTKRPFKKNSRLSIKLTQELIKFIVQNADKAIFSVDANNTVTQLRLREINLEKILQEKKGTDKWHEINSKMESDFVLSNKNNSLEL